LAVAVVQRNKLALKTMISNGDNVDGGPFDTFPPLYLAIGWLEGTKMLLDAGADPSSAIHLAVIRGDYNLVDMLLSYGASIFYDPSHSHSHHMLRQWTFRWTENAPPAYFESILGFYGWIAGTNPSGTKALCSLVCAAMARSYRNLQNFGIQKIPWTRLAPSGVDFSDKDTLSEVLIQTILQELQVSQIDIPHAFSPGQLRSVHHTGPMTAQIASELYEAGFRNLVIPDGSGRTPFLLHCSDISNGDWGRSPDSETLAAWYLSQDFSPRELLGLTGTTCLHVLAHSASWSFAPKILDPGNQLRNLLGEEVSDGCQCFCSTSGCLPCTVFYKTTRRWSSGLPIRLAEWVPETYAFAKKRIVLTEMCRVEIFYRLGMCHTCCEVPWNQRPLTADQIEIRNEDQIFAEYLSIWVSAFSKLMEAHDQEHIDVFWHSWWDAVDKLLPAEPDGGAREIYERFPATNGKQKGIMQSYSPDVESLSFEIRMAMKAAQAWRRDWYEFPDSIIDCFSI
jgi:hypothetical protein